MCPTAQWTPGDKACPVEHRLGGCTSKDGARWLYSGPPNNYSAASAKASCEFAGGVFAPSP
jgi:hypothetical protein